jgi:opacity protein-like surface antigen
VKRLLLAALLACAPLSAFAAPNLGGVWKIKGAFPTMGVNYTATCTLKQDPAGGLAGVCVGDNGESDPAAGKVAVGAGGKAAFEVGYDTHYSGVAIHLAYTGEQQPNGSIVGAVASTPGPQGTFTAGR